MITAEQQQANLQSAANLALSRVGVTRADLQASHELRGQYNHELASIIVQYPDRFSQSKFDWAVTRMSAIYEPDSDTSIDWSAFGAEVANQASSVGFTVSTGVIVGLTVLLLAPHVKKVFS